MRRNLIDLLMEERRGRLAVKTELWFMKMDVNFVENVYLDVKRRGPWTELWGTPEGTNEAWDPSLEEDKLRTIIEIQMNHCSWGGGGESKSE